MPLAALAAGVCFLLLAAIHATHGEFDAQFTTTVDWLNELAFLGALVLSIPGLVLLRRRWGAPARAVGLAVAGQSLIALGVAIGLPLGESPAWFMVLAAPGILATLGGTAWLAHWAWRSRALPRWTAVALALVVPAGIVAGSVGGGIVPAALWAYVGLRAASMRL